ncbi:MAG TPA: hypothetical protein DEQ26_05370, partial [Flavobacteriaceae bacterium]|nr:hypothetical protein [Flavobacteriaceae bacterium]
MIKKITNLLALLILIISCQDGSPAAYNEEYIMFDKSKDLPFSKLIGKYKLDKDSKIRYNIPDSLDFYIELGIKNGKDTFLSANRYVNPMDRTIVDNFYYNNKVLYLNDFKTLSPSNNDFLGG